MQTIPERIQALRALMNERQIDAYLIPSGDPHQSEYVAPHWETRAWMSGFTGSAGTLIITHDHAGLWTDSRYFVQAEQQLAGSDVVLHKQQIPHAPEHIDWLATHLPAGSKLGLDGMVVSLATVRALERQLTPKGIHLVTSYDLPGQLWATRPPIPASEVYDFPVSYAGEGREQRLDRLRQWLSQQGGDALLLVALDDIAWTLNIRAADVDYNPVCLSYLLVEKNDAQWFAGRRRVPEALQSQLSEAGVAVKEYEEAADALAHFASSSVIVVDPATISHRFYELLAGKNIQEAGSPVVSMKAIKNEVEINNWQQCMRRDGVALLRLFRWLETTLRQREVPEVEVGEQLARFRSQQALYIGESFPAIVGYQANGAIVHYRAEEGSCAMLQPEGILLLDSGGQYWDGTTDITRTVALGRTTEAQRQHFTLVLKGMIALSMAKFPEGTSGAQLDTLARQFLWQENLNYGHGTGHGVGYFLNVHEGPQGFATSAVTSRGRTAFRAGMVTSNEPGFYREGHYGIRTENLMLCVADGTSLYGNFFRFETLTLFPIDKRLVAIEMLTRQERDWLDRYHQQVQEALMPLLNDEEERAWLAAQCAPLVNDDISSLKDLFY
ncbi:MAG: aminopeptidase P family protein [Saprospiraceae bacterium]